MAYRNRIRLPLTIDRPQYKEVRDVYRRADGKSIVQSVVISKILQGATDWWPGTWHEAFKIALASDQTTIETSEYFGDVVQNGDYQINWQDRFNRRTAPAEFKVEVSPFDATNSNCQTCEEVTQLSLTDDDWSQTTPYTRTPLNEGSTTVRDVTTNDDICCYPVAFSIIYYNADIVQSAVISSLGVVTMVLKTPLADANGLKLATYRATCPNGGYDEADIYADIDGSIPACLAPTDPAINTISGDGARAVWNEPSIPPALGYHWQLFRQDSPGAPFLEGDALGLTVLFTSVLSSGTAYIFYVQSKCDPDTVSNYVSVNFTTLIPSGGPGGPTTSCGRYSVFYANPEFPYMNSHVQYTNCSGFAQSDVLINGVQRYICVLENSPGSPVSIVVEGADPRFHNWQYIEPC